MSKGTRLPEDWQPDPADTERMRKEFPGFDLAAELENFRDYWTAKAGAAATKMNWNATYRIWMRKAGKDPKAAKHQAFRPQAPVPHAQRSEPDHLLYFANRLLFRHLSDRHGIGAVELAAALKVKRETIEWFTRPVLEGDENATPKEFVTQFAKALTRVSPLSGSTRRRWRALLESSDAQKPFPVDMARVLTNQAHP